MRAAQAGFHIFQSAQKLLLLLEQTQIGARLRRVGLSAHFVDQHSRASQILAKSTYLRVDTRDALASFRHGRRVVRF
ncbi:hypothetical protein WI71_01965 [Burkholderia diffusa]|nr:hypothetical protein WI71_01965 [Burkholderia diffusa]